MSEKEKGVEIFDLSYIISHMNAVAESGKCEFITSMEDVLKCGVTILVKTPDGKSHLAPLKVTSFYKIPDAAIPHNLIVFSPYEEISVIGDREITKQSEKDKDLGLVMFETGPKEN